MQHFFLCRLLGFDPALRTTAEHTDPNKGTYELDRIPLTDLAQMDLRPPPLRDFIAANSVALVADLPPASPTATGDQIA